MNTIKLQIIFLIVFCLSAKAQFIDTIKLKQNPPQKAIYVTIYGDPSLMELDPNGIIYRFKKDLPDGKYVAFFKKVLNGDTAMVAVIKNGRINGLLQRWDNNLHDLSEECEYVDGYKTGFRKLYYTTPDKIRLVNIERWEGSILQEEILTQW
jgi:antitoxin component YwqK of YwqJK toxin-antitoxin module